MRYLIVAAWLALVPTAPALAAVGVSIGINLPVYPRLVPVPGYPVYYAPSVNGNYFFYDGMYWVFDGDNWYDSQWYNGPWGVVDPFYVPSFILQVPVRYYRHPPAFFRGWRADRAPLWHEHWGASWAERRGDWARFDRRNAPRAAPLPSYQRQYSGNRYPSVEQQRDLQTRNYRYQPREQVVQEHYRQQQGEQRGQGQGRPRERDR